MVVLGQQTERNKNEENGGTLIRNHKNIYLSTVKALRVVIKKKYSKLILEKKVQQL